MNSLEQDNLYENYKDFSRGLNSVIGDTKISLLRPLKNKGKKSFIRGISHIDDGYYLLDRDSKSDVEKLKIFAGIIESRVLKLVRSVDIKSFFEAEFKDQKISTTKSGFRTLCPFHNEKKASFSVLFEGKSYRCYGCGQAGDVFRYLEKTKDISKGFRSSGTIDSRNEWIDFLLRSGIKLDQYQDSDHRKKMRDFSLFVGELRGSFLKSLNKKIDCSISNDQKYISFDDQNNLEDFMNDDLPF